MELVDYVFVDNENYRPAISVDNLSKPSPDTWELILCEPDGNCFYHALARSTHKVKTPMRIRMDLLRYIDRTKYKLPNMKDVVDRIFNGIEAEYNDSSVTSAGWANHEEIQLCARMYNIVICTWNADFKMWTACFPKDDLLLLSQCRKAVYLYNDGIHFNLLKRKLIQSGSR